MRVVVPDVGWPRCFLWQPRVTSVWTYFAAAWPLGLHGPKGSGIRVYRVEGVLQNRCRLGWKQHIEYIIILLRRKFG